LCVRNDEEVSTQLHYESEGITLVLLKHVESSSKKNNPWPCVWNSCSRAVAYTGEQRLDNSPGSQLGQIRVTSGENTRAEIMACNTVVENMLFLLICCF